MLRLRGGDQEVRTGEPAEAADAYRRLAGVFHAVLSEESPDALLDRIGAALAELVPHDALTVRWDGRDPVHLDRAGAAAAGGVRPSPGGAHLGLALVSRGRAKGSLDVYRSGAGGDFSPHELELARRFADALALALDNAEIRGRLEQRAQSDSLTGLYNHRTFHQRLRAAVAEAEPAGQPVAVLMLDLDDFKRVNDVHGHAAGDEVLQRFSDVLSQAVRGSDVVCRAGGEEFAVVLPGADSQAARIIAARLAEAIASERFTAGTLTASMGIAHFPLHASTARELAVCAEAAMMTAKAQGKDQIVVFDEGTAGRPDAAPDGRDARALAHLRLLQTLIGRLWRLADPPAVGRLLADEVCPLAEVSGCRVYVADGGQLTAVASAGTLGASGRDYGFGEGLAGRAAASGRPELAATDAEAAGPGGAWAAAVPLAVDGRIAGVVVVTQTGERRLDDHDVRLLEVLAGPAAVALDNARLYQAALRDAEDARAELRLLRAASANAA
jgi:diguanylate cyclase (GGDEF)-like protein